MILWKNVHRFLARLLHLRGMTAGAADAGVVEQDRFAVLGESVDQRGIPVIHGSFEAYRKLEQYDDSLRLGRGCSASPTIGASTSCGGVEFEWTLKLLQWAQIP